MNKKKIINDFLMHLRKLNKWNITQASNKARFEDLKKHNIPIKKLSASQKAEIDAIYKKYGYKYSYDTHILTYSVTGEFDPKIIPEDMFRSSLEYKLNSIEHKFVMSDKNYFEMYMPENKFPDVIIRNIDGVLYDKDRNIITQEKAQELLLNYEKVVVKPSVENGSGRGVELVLPKEKNVTQTFKKNYIVQELIEQHPSLSAFNESSVNVIRVTTMFMDGKVFPLGSAFRFGGEGAFTDNTVTKDGKGMTVVGIDDDGKLKDKGFFSCGLSVSQSRTGITLKGYEIPKFKEMVDLAIKQHSRFPTIKVVGWDFTVDKNENIITVEYNIKAPGVLYYQWVNGPLFGDRTIDILDKIKNLPE